MEKLNNDEQKLFLALCKYIRHLQDIGVQQSMRGGVSLNAWELRGTFSMDERTPRTASGMHDHAWHLKKSQAVAYSLQEKGFVKISKKYKFRGRYISLDDKGVEYIQYLKSKQNKEM